MCELIRLAIYFCDSRLPAKTRISHREQNTNIGPRLGQDTQNQCNLIMGFAHLICSLSALPHSPNSPPQKSRKEAFAIGIRESDTVLFFTFKPLYPTKPRPKHPQPKNPHAPLSRVKPTTHPPDPLPCRPPFRILQHPYNKQPDSNTTFQHRASPSPCPSLYPFITACN